MTRLLSLGRMRAVWRRMHRETGSDLRSDLIAMTCCYPEMSEDLVRYPVEKRRQLFEALFDKTEWGPDVAGLFAVLLDAPLLTVAEEDKANVQDSVIKALGELGIKVTAVEFIPLERATLEQSRADEPWHTVKLMMQEDVWRTVTLGFGPIKTMLDNGMVARRWEDNRSHPTILHRWRNESRDLVLAGVFAKMGLLEAGWWPLAVLVGQGVTVASVRGETAYVAVYVAR